MRRTNKLPINQARAARTCQGPGRAGDTGTLVIATPRTGSAPRPNPQAARRSRTPRPHGAERARHGHVAHPSRGRKGVASTCEPHHVESEALRLNSRTNTKYTRDPGQTNPLNVAQRKLFFLFGPREAQLGRRGYCIG